MISGGASEHEHQAALVQWFDAAYPSLRGRLLAIPNGGHRHPLTAIKLRAEGVRSGVPDLLLPVPCGGCHGLFVELKAGKGRPSKSQLDWLQWLADRGYAAYCCTGWDAARRTITEYLHAGGIDR